MKGISMLGELTEKIKLHFQPMSVNEAVQSARLVRKGLEVPLTFHDGKRLVVGRDDQVATLVINDIFISRTHAAIIQEDEGFYLQDLNSKNGTFLNGMRLPAGGRSFRPLCHGDKVSFNNVEFEFVVPGIESPLREY